MKARWGNPSAFRADPNAAPATRPSRRQTVALLATVALVSGAVALASYLIHPGKARAFDLFHGSLFLSDSSGPVAVDLATGKPTLRLSGAAQQVGITSRDQTLGVVPLAGDTLLLNQATGEFNMVDNSGFVVKHGGGGVLLDRSGGESAGIASRDGQAYIVSTGAAGGTDVYLVGEPTVESAINASGKVRPRASDSISEQVGTAPGAAASANGDLWVLAGPPGGERTISELSVPLGSSSGAALEPSPHGRVSGPAAIGTATEGTDGSGADTVAVATRSGIDVFAAGGDKEHLSYAAPAGIDSILPTSSAQGRLAFFLHGKAGWYLVSINADGTGLREPVPVQGLPATAQLAEPAASNGRLYTIDKADGRLYQIGYDDVAHSVAGRSTYPVVAQVEAATFGDAYVIARGPRVIFDSPSHTDALMVFTDGSHTPRTIAKSAAVTVNASGGADSLTRSTAPAAKQVGKRTGPAKPVPAVQPVNTKINCKLTKQKPHIPVITSAVTGSRSVTLAWSYPILDVQDCYPSTYTVSFKLLGTNAPQPPSTVRVQSQTGATIGGLFPSTRYDVTVRAYINGQSTASKPTEILTGEEGPAAPTAVRASADATGDWRLSWDSCGSVEHGCVPAQSWTITPSFCDGRGVSSPPPAITVTADPTSKHQPPAIYKGRADLLGRGLQFQVQGTGDQGQAGAPSAKSACIYSWSPPVASTLRLSASQPANTALGGSARTNVTLDLGSNPVADVGGVGAVVTFRLTGGGSSETKSVTFDGNATSLSANFGGVQAGASYRASATVRAAHGGSAISIPPVDVTTRANWPAMSLSANCPPTNPVTCQLSVQINGLTSAQAHHERFDFDGVLQCGSTGFDISRSAIDPGHPIDAGPVSQLNKFFGSCTISGQLKESAGTPAPEVFGGTVKNLGPSPVNLGAPARSGAGQGDFAVSWDNGTDVKIHYTGNADLRTLTENWAEKVFAPDGTDCADPDGQAMPDTTVHVDAACVNRSAGQGPWTVSISYQDTTDGTFEGPFHEQLPNGPTGFSYCRPTNLSATWGIDPKQPTIAVTQSGDIDGCGHWSYDLTNPKGRDCPTSGDHGPPPVTLKVTCDVTTQGSGWQLTVSWDGPAGPQSVNLNVQGVPPTPTPSPPPS